MDLKNNQITIRELMAHPQARAVLAKHFPQVIHLPIVTKSAGMTLERAMKLGAAFVPARPVAVGEEDEAPLLPHPAQERQLLLVLENAKTRRFQNHRINHLREGIFVIAALDHDGLLDL